jgi:hypothetical protein
MASTKATRRGFAIVRQQTHTSREIFLAHVRDDLPRVALGNETEWNARGRHIGLCKDADRFLVERGFDRSGRRFGTRRRAGKS